MFDIEKACESIREAIAELEKSGSPSTSDIKTLVATRQLLDSTCDQILSRYAQSQEWKDEGFLSGQQTIVYKTGALTGNVKTALEKGNLLNRYPKVKEAIAEGSISYDHVTPLVPLLSEKYVEYFDTDAPLLLNSAKLMPAHQFSRMIRHWKYSVDEIIDDPTDEYQRFEERYLHLYETEFGYWRIDGKLDPVTGMIAKKALEDVRSQLWQSHHDRRNENHHTESETDNPFNVECDDDYTSYKQRADAIGYLAQGYINASAPASTPVFTGDEETQCDEYNAAEAGSYIETSFTYASSPVLNVDVVIDINDLKPQSSTRPFIEKCLTEATPIISAYSKNYLEQMLCDSLLEVPIKHNDGIYDLGRTVRTAPPKLKKQLLLGQNTCSIDGCITPAKWCDVHHIQHWAHGGKTSLDNLVLLCRRHHSMTHFDEKFIKLTEGKFTKPPNLQRPLPMARTG